MSSFSTQSTLGDSAEKGAEIDPSADVKEIPRSAALIAGQSLAPSPTMAQTIPNRFNDFMTIALCSGRHLPNKAVREINFKISSSSDLKKRCSKTAPCMTIYLF
jgi:hypothetical protein